MLVQLSCVKLLAGVKTGTVQMVGSYIQCQGTVEDIQAMIGQSEQWKIFQLC